jgi:hypothetical protein
MHSKEEKQDLGERKDKKHIRSVKVEELVASRMRERERE